MSKTVLEKSDQYFVRCCELQLRSADEWRNGSFLLLLVAGILPKSTFPDSNSSILPSPVSLASKSDRPCKYGGIYAMTSQPSGIRPFDHIWEKVIQSVSKTVLEKSDQYPSSNSSALRWSEGP